MTTYSAEFKASIIAKMLPPNNANVPDLAAETQIPKDTLYSWGRDGALKLWDVTKAEPLQAWKHDRGVSGAVFSRDESRVLAWSGDRDSSGEVKLWDAALEDMNLAPAQRIVELEVRSATWLSPAGLVAPLTSAEWITKVCSPEYKAVQRKTKSALLPLGDCKIDSARH